MTEIQAIILGVIQGITEFLPVSSSGHLVAVPWILRWPAHSLNFDIMLHLATFFAIIIYFRRDWFEILREGFLSIKERSLNGPVQRRLFWYIILASLPAVIFGAHFGKRMEYGFRAPVSVAFMLGVFGLVLFMAELGGKREKSLGEITWKIALFIGISQILAIIPGVSRSGITISAALLVGVDRGSAVKFSFLLGAPIIFAAACYSISKPILEYTSCGVFARLSDFLFNPGFLAGFIAAFLSGMAAIHFLLKFVRKYPFSIFVAYRLAIAVLMMVVLLLR